MTSIGAVQQSYKIGAKKNYKLTNTKSKAKQLYFYESAKLSRVWCVTDLRRK